MKKSIRILFISIILFLIGSNNANASEDILFRFMHNDHDALIIGTVTSIEDNIMTIKSIDRIVSASSINNKEQLWFDEASFPLTIYAPERFNVGDHVIVSLHKKEKGLFIRNGLYKVSGTDFRTLKVEHPICPATGTMLTDFVNSGGLYTQYSIGGGEIVTRYYLGEETVIYNHAEAMALIDSQNEEPQSENLQNENSNHIINIIGGSACLVSLVIVTIFIIKKKNV
ncbi:MAG: hypothetical protein FWG14_00125 [Peptococcaceae bacterium]|nr:hypothetical protein [Peptococcaceae bacterium]